MKLKDSCSQEESYDQPRQHTKKQRHYFASKGPSSQSYGFPVVMYGCESWTIKKLIIEKKKKKKETDHWRIDAFELCCWRRLLRVPWTATRSNQSILKEISPEQSIHWKDWCWSWSSNTLATWCELTEWKRLYAGKDWRQEKGVTEDEMVGWHHLLDGHEFE